MKVVLDANVLFRREFVGKKSEKAATNQENALDHASDAINGGLSGNND